METKPSVPDQNDRMMAAACHLSSLVGIGFIAPLAIYFTQRERSGFVARHALQALFLQLAATIVTALFVAVGLGLLAATVGVSLLAHHSSSDLAAIPVLLWLGFLAGSLLPGILYMLAMVFGTLESFQGREAGLPLLGKLAHSIHPQG